MQFSEPSLSLKLIATIVIRICMFCVHVLIFSIYPVYDMWPGAISV